MVPVQYSKKNPDPLARGTDPGIRIRLKMSRIPNTAWSNHYGFQYSMLLKPLEYLQESPSENSYWPKPFVHSFEGLKSIFHSLFFQKLSLYGPFQQI